MTKDEAKDYFLNFSYCGYTKYSVHFQDQAKKRNFLTDDFIYIVEHGKIVNHPQYDKKHEDWKCKVKGQTVDREKVTFIFSIDNIKNIVTYISVYGE